MLRKTLVAVAAAVAVALPGTAASAQPPQEVVFDDFIVLFPDSTLNKSVFINITARDFCEWLEAPSGPPPAIDLVTGRETMTGKGAVVGKIDAEDLYIEMWNLGEEGPQEGPCEDIQDQLDDPTAQPWATGTASFKAKDNDIFGTGTRGNAFGDRTTAQLTGSDGEAYSYSSIFRLNDRCTAPEFGPPSCLVEKSKLKML